MRIVGGTPEHERLGAWIMRELGADGSPPDLHLPGAEYDACSGPSGSS